jgi:hypothetical protein
MVKESRRNFPLILRRSHGDFTAIARRLLTYCGQCAVNAHGLRGDRAAIARRLRGDCAAITRQLDSYCTAIARRSLGD